MGNTVVWKPSPTQQLAAHFTMRLFEAAGLPARRDQHGDRRRPGRLRGRAGRPRPGRHPLHRLDRGVPHLWQHGRRATSSATAATRARRRDRRQGLRGRAPVAPTPTRWSRRWSAAPSSTRARSARRRPARTSRRRSGTAGLRDQLAATADELTYGDVTDFANFGGAVIDARAFDRHAAALDRIKNSRVVHGARRRHRRRQRGLLRAPDRRRVHRPGARGVHDRVLRPDPRRARLSTTPTSTRSSTQAESVAPYALTGVDLRHRPPRGRPGDARRCASPPATSTSTTSRPARSSASSRSAARAPPAPTTRPARWHNLLRWTSPRTIKETFVPPTDHRYPHMG